MGSLTFRWCLVLSALVLLSACGGAQRAAPEDTASADETTDVNGFLQEVMAGRQAYAYDDLVALLGRPVRVKTMPVAGTDTVRTLIYYGLEVGLHEGASPTRLVHLALTGARYTAPEGIRVGYAESQVISTLGLPARREPAQLIYEKERPQECVMVVFLERRAVSRVEWRFGAE